MIRDGRLTELRTTYNGSYGAALLYYPDEMLYYVALFQQKKFWRVLKTQNDARAEATYAEFSKSTASLGDTEIRRLKLEAEKAYADRLIASQQNRANRLQADLEVARAQQGQVAERQQEQQEAIRSLRAEQAAAQAQLRALQQRVNELQKQADGDLAAPLK
jgi:chromosome segregation ATPase